MTKSGNKKAEELDRLIRDTQRRRADPNVPANGNTKEGQEGDNG